MQVNNISAKPQPQQSFGMSLSMHNDAVSALRKRVKNADLDKFNSILENLKERNDVGVTLYTTSPNSTRLMANLYPTDVSLDVRTRYPKEGLFHQFRNPIKYLASLVDKANAMEHEVAKAKVKRDVFDKIG